MAGIERPIVIKPDLSNCTIFVKIPKMTLIRYRLGTWLVILGCKLLGCKYEASGL